MRISDWSSDVCSSDLWRLRLAGGEGEGEQGDGGQGLAHGGSGLAWEGADSVTKPPRRHVEFACGGAEPLRGAKVQAPDQESSHDQSRKLPMRRRRLRPRGRGERRDGLPLPEMPRQGRTARVI